MTFERVPQVKPPCGHDVLARGHDESFYRCAGCTEVFEANVVSDVPPQRILVELAKIGRWNLARIGVVSFVVMLTYLSMRGRATDVSTLLLMIGHAHSIGTAALAWYWIRARMKPVARRRSTAAPGGMH